MHDPMIDPSESADLLRGSSNIPWWVGHLILLTLILAWLMASVLFGNLLSICFSLLILANCVRLFIRKARILREEKFARRIQIDPVTLLPVDKYGKQMYSDLLFKEIRRPGGVNGPVIRHYIHRHSGKSLYFSDGGRYWEWRPDVGGFAEIDQARAWAQFYG